MTMSQALAPLHRFGAKTPTTLSHQIAQLAAEVATIAGQLRKQGGNTLEEVGHSAGELAGQIAHQFAPLARQVRRQATVAGRMVRNDPVPAVIALGTFALLATLLLRRR